MVITIFIGKTLNTCKPEIINTTVKNVGGNFTLGGLVVSFFKMSSFKFLFN